MALVSHVPVPAQWTINSNDSESPNPLHFRTINYEDYNKGLIEVLAELSVASKDIITQAMFNDWVDYVQYNPYYFVIVLEYMGVIVATGSILIERKLIHNASTVGHIEDVVVKNEFRGKNFGKLIIDKLTKIAEEHNCYKVILDCDAKNVNFYQKCGYHVHGLLMRKDM